MERSTRIRCEWIVIALDDVIEFFADLSQMDSPSAPRSPASFRDRSGVFRKPLGDGKQRAPRRERVEDGDTSSARQAGPKRKRLSAPGSLTTCRRTVLSASN